MTPSDDAIHTAIEQAIGEHELILFMKGTPEQPPPRTPTRSPEVPRSAPCEARNSWTFSAPFSVKVITCPLLLGSPSRGPMLQEV